MEKKRVKCPNCGGILEVTNPKNEEVLLIKCPNPECNAKIRLRFDTGETQMSKLSADMTCPGKLLLGSQEYALQEGKNTLGRATKSTTATLPIETDDRSMSRLHVEIEVVRLKNGRMKALLRDIREPEKTAQKPTLVEGEALYPTDCICLTHGDIITISDTEFRFVQEA